MHSFSVNIRISQPSKVMFTVLGLTNPDVNLKRMHQLYNMFSLKTDIVKDVIVELFVKESVIEMW